MYLVIFQLSETYNVRVFNDLYTIINEDSNLYSY